ncbi:lipase/acyltransferase domain-containing protein [Piscirickettsia litoralis]|uniref:Uncharacterized protein n=1 Tax=Piscirickettsia litoralis TaxID=1891921 RepID=A0ABX3ABS9_9GAMM|nr:alpha/beta hydrolase [Piscirickettsia litoralis]ODN43574.1 hypothetical protein BGC07_12450 [Piscirickettsia litoralis]
MGLKEDSIIIAIHGLKNKNSAEVAENWWKQAILEGLRKNCQVEPEFNFKLHYWADLIYKYPLHNDERYRFDKLYNHNPYKEAEQNSFTYYKPRLFGVSKGRQTLSQFVFRRTLNFLQRYNRISSWVSQKILREVEFYYNEKVTIHSHSNQQSSLRNILIKEFIEKIRQHQGKRILILAHSMGAVIAYDALRNIRSFLPNINIELFITIGAPLTYSVFRTNPYLDTEHGHARRILRTPTAVNSWFNIVDPDDLACYSRLRLFYYKNRKGVVVEDIFVKNEYQYTSHKTNKTVKNPHEVYGYLRTPEVSSLLLNFIENKKTTK